MNKGVFVRLLVPKRGSDGKIEYQEEMRWVRLPLRRDDRQALLERLTNNQPE